MGKASSAKKVARAAGLGGNRAYATRPPYGYYASIAILVILGIVGVFNARDYLSGRVANNGGGKPSVNMSPPWYTAYSVDECGKIIDNISSPTNSYGFTTKGNGIIYISPKKKAYAGHNATLGKFAAAAGMTLNAAAVKTPGGKLYADGQSCEGKAGHVYVEVWSSSAEPQASGVIQTKSTKSSSTNNCDPDCDSGVLLKDGAMVTIAFLPSGKNNAAPTNIPQPPAKVRAALNALESPAETTTTLAPTSSTAATGGSTTTTVKGQTTPVQLPTTTVKGQTTTTAGAGTTTTTSKTTSTTAAK